MTSAILCHAPQERLYRNGLWQEGLLPHIGVTRSERDQYARFHDLIAGFRRGRDAHGRKAFALPLDLSSRDPDLLALDRRHHARLAAGAGTGRRRRCTGT